MKVFQVGDLVSTLVYPGNQVSGRVVEVDHHMIRIEDRISLHLCWSPVALADFVSQEALELADLKQQIRDLARYLQSSKFAKDPTVQVADVLTRLGLR